MRCRNRAVPNSASCHFCDVSILLSTFSSWILSSGLNCARELRASNLKHKDCCFHHLQNLFVEGCIVRQLDFLFLILLTSQLRRSKIEDFLSVLMLNHSGEKIIGEFLLKLWRVEVRRSFSRYGS